MKNTLTILFLFFATIGFAQNNYSLQFDGVDDEVVLVGTNTIGNFGTGNFTVSQWFKSSSTLTGHFCNSFLKFGGTNNYYDITPLSNIQNQCVFHFAAGTGQDNYAVGTVRVDDGNWHYITGVREVDTIRLYIDGVFQHQTTLPASAIADNIGDISIKPNACSDSSPVNTNVTNTELWSIALTQQEIQQYMTCPPTGTETGLVGYWNFEEGTGTTTSDLTSNGNNGTLNGGVTWSTDVPTQNCNTTPCLVASYPFNGNANDESGWGNDGTVNGATLTTDRFGNANSAYSFDGVDDEIVVNHSNKLDLMDMTITMWVKTMNTGGGIKCLISKENFNNNDIDGEWWVYLNHMQTDKVNFYVIENSNQSGVVHNTPVNDDTWHFIAITRNGTTGEHTIIIDGQNQVTNTGVPGLLSEAVSMYIGGGNNYNFDGVLDDIKIFDCSLSSNQVDSIYQYENTPTGLKHTLDYNGVIVYPNPISNYFTIHSNNSIDKTINIFNSVGQLVFETKTNNQTFTIDVNEIGSKGIYFIKVLDSKKNILKHEKLVIQ